MELRGHLSHSRPTGVATEAGPPGTGLKLTFAFQLDFVEARTRERHHLCTGSIPINDIRRQFSRESQPKLQTSLVRFLRWDCTTLSPACHQDSQGLRAGMVLEVSSLVNSTSNNEPFFQPARPEGIMRLAVLKCKAAATLGKLGPSRGAVIPKPIVLSAPRLNESLCAHML